MKCTGVYWMGHVYDMGGYGNVSRNYIKALEAAGIPVFIHPIGENHPEIGADTRRWLETVSTGAIGDRVALIRHGLPNMFVQPMHVPHVVKNIGVTLFETDRLPEGWAHSCNHMDEIWVPSTFNYHTFSASGVLPSKLRVVPYAIDVTKYYPGKSSRNVVLFPGRKRFQFLYVFGFDWRKGFDLLIRAFCEEFALSEPVSLVLKVYIHSGYDPAHVHAAIASHIPQDRVHTQIVLLLDSFNENELIDLYQSSDVYVSMDRAAGWGMPVMESMALGKPTMALGWGGSMEFMNKSNSFLIPVLPELIPVDAKLQQARPEMYLHHRWADVPVKNVRKSLREAYEYPAKRLAIAKKASLDIHLNYSPHAVGSTLKSLLGVDF